MWQAVSVSPLSLFKSTGWAETQIQKVGDRRRAWRAVQELHRTYLLPAICWAACGKHPGFSPLSLIKMMKRFAKVSPTELDKIKARALDPKLLKVVWVEMSDTAEAETGQRKTESSD